MAEIVSKPSNPVFRDNMDRIFGTKEKEDKKTNILVHDKGDLKITKNPTGLGGFRFYFKCGDVSKQIFITDEQFQAMCEFEGIHWKH